jgi:hypothetical protein
MLIEIDDADVAVLFAVLPRLSATSSSGQTALARVHHQIADVGQHLNLQWVQVDEDIEIGVTEQPGEPSVPATYPPPRTPSQKTRSPCSSNVTVLETPMENCFGPSPRSSTPVTRPIPRDQFANLSNTPGGRKDKANSSGLFQGK